MKKNYKDLFQEIIMLTKIYAAILSTVALAAGTLFLTGNFTMLTAVVFGFISFGLIFMGMMFVIPTTVADPAPAQAGVGSPKRSVSRQPINALASIRSLKAELLSGNGVEIRKPKFH